MRDQNKQIVDLINELVQPGDVVLDVACGTGTILQALDDRIKRIGLDIACGMITKARETTSRDISYFLGNAEQPTFQKEIADVVLCKNSFYFMNPERAISAFSWLTKSHGHLILTTYSENPDFERLWKTALHDSTVTVQKEYEAGYASESDLVQAKESLEKEPLFQVEVQKLTNKPIPYDKLEKLLLDNSYSIIKLIDDDHYCGTQYLIVASKV
ncbi:MAG: class I SAM-dependent methyltransferase [Candidatus Heimdallarchaeaceae archaeon]